MVCSVFRQAQLESRPEYKAVMKILTTYLGAITFEKDNALNEFLISFSSVELFAEEADLNKKTTLTSF